MNDERTRNWLAVQRCSTSAGAGGGCAEKCACGTRAPRPPAPPAHAASASVSTRTRHTSSVSTTRSSSTKITYDRFAFDVDGREGAMLSKSDRVSIGIRCTKTRTQKGKVCVRT